MPDETLSKDRILVVDDTPDSLRFLVDTLERENMAVLIANSGEAAIELLNHVTPDLILMDAVMPGLSGFEATRNIKRTPDHAHIPVIFMTGLTDPENVVAAMEAGGVDYVRKPIVVSELLARLRVHLSNARISHGSRLALDATGRHLIAVDDRGALLWCTPQAENLIARILPGWAKEEKRLPAELARPVERLCGGSLGAGASLRAEAGDFEVELTLVEAEKPGERLIRLTEIREDAQVELLQKQHGLTRREAEVLLWVSYGKPNRVISEILDISPRTVNKHLEKVFEKLGVETRAAATAMAVRTVTG
ncbi:response regulator [Stakelama sp. CBK3Z-3]|uniref:Response regulator n=1 Tax=Stakelama flava TaxID=2860338 RepID=A0ABS6XK66_9SPHN|nr:response regulator [Stakelama flava]MBW4330565.1 response regulator [Stakelama flava]